MPKEQKPSLLLVEDDQDDLLIIKQAIEKVGFGFPVQEVRNGEDAMHYLAGDGRFADRAQFPLPFLILLDLKMPGWNGFDLLRWLQYRPDLQQIPVVILTSSGMDDDVQKA
jgi:CheY-like chemotaxis protein